MLAGAIGGGFGFFVMNIGLSYIMGVVVTGAVIGVMVALSEQVFRKASIDVTLQPLTTGITLTKAHCFNVTLGSDPISVGFNADMDINLTSTGIVMQKQVDNIKLESGKVFFTFSVGNEKENEKV